MHIPWAKFKITANGLSFSRPILNADSTENKGLSRRVEFKIRTNAEKQLEEIAKIVTGDKDLKITIPENSHYGLKKGLLKIAKRKNVCDKIVACNDIIIDDHVPFLEAGFKSIDLIDFEYGSKPGLNDYWHTKDDTGDKISEKSLLFAGEVATWLINGLDR